MFNTNIVFVLLESAYSLNGGSQNIWGNVLAFYDNWVLPNKVICLSVTLRYEPASVRQTSLRNLLTL